MIRFDDRTVWTASTKSRSTEIRAALERYDKISAFFTAPAEAPPLVELRKAVNHAWLTFQHSKYGVLARMLPKLLRDAQAANAAYSAEPGQQAAHLLGEVYQISSSTLRKLGEHDLAWLAADRALMVCQRADDELLAGIATTGSPTPLPRWGGSGPRWRST